MEETQKDQALNPKPRGIKRFWQAYKTKKKISIPLTLIALVAIILAIPYTRYATVGLFVKKNISVVVVDSQNQKPVSAAVVSLQGEQVSTNSKGEAVFRSTTPGPSALKAQKKYYSSLSSNVSVPIFDQKTFRLKLVATGRQVPVTVLNKISSSPVVNATITAKETSIKTNKNGQATIVLPAGEKIIEGLVSQEGFSDQSIKITVSQAVLKENTFTVVPKGSIYFLSKASGTIDVVKTKLDGSERKVVLAGTGKEDEKDTILLASRDWKYLALKSQRDGGTSAKLFLIDTATDTLSEIDSGDASFSLVGWANHRFIYETIRNNVQYWQPKQIALKSFEASGGTITTLDESKADGIGPFDYASEVISKEYILDNQIVYLKQWSGYPIERLAGKKNGIFSVKPEGGTKQVLKDITSASNGTYSNIDAKLYKPEEIYFAIYQGGDYNAAPIFELENGKISEAKDSTVTSFNQKIYPTFILSPSGKQTFWAESRDGKNTLFIGEQDASDAKQFASLSEYVPYGWYSDEYMIVSKNSSELYIFSSGVIDAKHQPIKVTDYHKPTIDFTGYGKGYGGF